MLQPPVRLTTPALNLAAGKYQPAVDQLSSALRGGGLASGDMAKALYLRGVSYKKMAKPGLAISDLDERSGLRTALGLPIKKAALAERAEAYRMAGLGDGNSGSDSVSVADPNPAPAGAKAATPPVASGCGAGRQPCNRCQEGLESRRGCGAGADGGTRADGHTASARQSGRDRRCQCAPERGDTAEGALYSAATATLVGDKSSAPAAAPVAVAIPSADPRACANSNHRCHAGRSLRDADNQRASEHSGRAKDRDLVLPPHRSMACRPPRSRRPQQSVPSTISGFLEHFQRRLGAAACAAPAGWCIARHDGFDDASGTVVR